MKKGLTEVVFILDRSGSMAGLAADTVGGFNSLLEKQKTQEGEALISTVLFNGSSEVLYDRVPMDKVRPMTANDYLPCGCTALLDAVGSAVRHISNVHKYIREEDVPEHTLFVITTDGMENASHRFTGGEVRSLIREKKEKAGWEFLFLGANIDAAEAAQDIGIDRDRAVDYTCDEKGTSLNFDILSETVCSVRHGKAITDNWCAPIRDYHKKKK